MTTGNATPSTSSGQSIESRRFGVDVEIEGISTERARRDLSASRMLIFYDFVAV